MTHELNGNREWHEQLRAEPAPLPELPDHPTPLELARAYVQLAMAYGRQWPLVVEGLQFLHGATMGAKAALEQLDKHVQALRHGTPPNLPARPALPSMSEYDPELTPAGGIRVTPEAWQRLQRAVEEQQERIEAAEQAARIAEARAQGANEAKQDLEKALGRFRTWVVFGVTVGTPIVGILAWAIAHFAHL